MASFLSKKLGEANENIAASNAESQTGRFVFDAHCHTLASGHAYSTINEYSNDARGKSLKFVAVTDHGPAMPGSFGELYFANIQSMPHNINGMQVLYGCEANIIDYNGKLDLPDSILCTLDVVIASIHPNCLEPQEDNTETIMRAMENRFVHIIGHPGDPRVKFDVPRVVAHAKETKTILEINNKSLDPMSPRYGGEMVLKQIIEECQKINWPVILASDAHFYLELANFEYIKHLVKDLPNELILNTSEELFRRFISSM